MTRKYSAPHLLLKLLFLLVLFCSSSQKCYHIFPEPKIIFSNCLTWQHVFNLIWSKTKKVANPLTWEAEMSKHLCSIIDCEHHMWVTPSHMMLTPHQTHQLLLFQPLFVSHQPSAFIRPLWPAWTLWAVLTVVKFCCVSEDRGFIEMLLLNPLQAHLPWVHWQQACMHTQTNTQGETLLTGDPSPWRRGCFFLNGQIHHRLESEEPVSMKEGWE